MPFSGRVEYSFNGPPLYNFLNYICTKRFLNEHQTLLTLSALLVRYFYWANHSI